MILATLVLLSRFDQLKLGTCSGDLGVELFAGLALNAAFAPFAPVSCDNGDEAPETRVFLGPFKVSLLPDSCFCSHTHARHRAHQQSLISCTEMGVKYIWQPRPQDAHSKQEE